MTERQKRAFSIKNRNNKKIYLEVLDLNDENNEDYGPTTCIVADLEATAEENDCDINDFDPDDFDMVIIPDWTPDWLYQILDLWDASEEVESYFTFETEEELEEFKQICDVINYPN